MIAFILRKFRILKFLSWCEGWRSYTRHANGKWVRVKLPKGRWQYTFCADPFLFRHKEENYVFFETMTREGKGVLGCSKEVDGKWIWQGIALEEPWHLSYPQVFDYDGRIYMIPESSRRGGGDVRLYEAVDFPLQWKMVSVLINRSFADSTLLMADGRFYLACYEVPPVCKPELWHADKLTGPWSRHPMWDKINSSRRLRRCGGQFINEDGNIYRVAQDCNGFYGKRLYRVPIVEISRNAYREGIATLIVDKNSKPKGMKHTYNRIDTPDGTLAVVDVHHDMFRPVGEIVRSLVKILMRKIVKWHVEI